MLVALITLIMGFTAGWFIAKETTKMEDKVPVETPLPSWMKDLDEDIAERMMNSISAKNIEEHLRY